MLNFQGTVYIRNGITYSLPSRMDQFSSHPPGSVLSINQHVEVSYKKLWKILINKDMKKKDLQAAAGISWASVTKLSKGETVSMEVLMKVCKTLNCDIGDIMELIPTEENETT